MTDKHDNYRNPRCACAPRVNEVQTLGAIKYFGRGRAKDACVHVHVKRTCNGKYTEKAKDGDPYIWAQFHTATGIAS